ncbi:hypothetical protein GGH92_009987, partial [Coemansia sp. RSA 2673]
TQSVVGGPPQFAEDGHAEDPHTSPISGSSIVNNAILHLTSWQHKSSANVDSPLYSQYQALGFRSQAAAEELARPPLLSRDSVDAQRSSTERTSSDQSTGEGLFLVDSELNSGALERLTTVVSDTTSPLSIHSFLGERRRAAQEALANDAAYILNSHACNSKPYSQCLDGASAEAGNGARLANSSSSPASATSRESSHPRTPLPAPCSGADQGRCNNDHQR